MEGSQFPCNLLLGLCFFLLLGGHFCAQSAGEEVMRWNLASNESAVCNDFTRAGFFLRRNSNSSKWIIFLESGSLCYSNETCNRRFFNRQVRESSNGNSRRISADAPFGNFDPQEAFNNHRKNPYKSYVNPLMTSMMCFRNSTSFGTNFSIEGRDLLSTNRNQNPDFYAHNHVLIPYCSSDLWLASEVLPTHPNSSCDCSDLDCFGYQPDSPQLQFAFRGKIIFQSIFNQLLDLGMNEASEIILGGSSAGGLGAINLAQWVREEMPSGANLLLIADSSWFINFQDNILRIFNGVTSQDDQSTRNATRNRLVGLLASHPSCANTDLGYPCCISASCVMTMRNQSGQLAFFPEGGQRTFLLTSVYDVFLLAPSLAGITDLESIDASNQTATTDFLVRLLRIVGEYGGVMNTTLSETYTSVSFLSYYLTQCFQHVYFATSTLWGGDGSVFGNSSIEFTRGLGSFSHSIASGRWNENLSSLNNTHLSTISALRMWYNSSNNVRFFDTCQGPQCNTMCPDRFTLGDLTSNNWPVAAKAVIAGLVIGLALICLCMKTAFVLWLYRLEKKQDNYLDSLDEELIGQESVLQFPECDENSAISVSCLDLTYTVTFKTKQVKDERKDQTEAVVLNELTEQQKAANEAEKSLNSRRQSRLLKRQSRLFQIRDSVIHNRRSVHLDQDADKGQPGNYSVPPGVIPPAPPPPPLPPIPIEDDEPSYNACGCQKTITKEILKGISIYFNPGEMIGIMGPSGCGKTTFLDVLTGRRRTGTSGGDIYINGIPMEEIRDWYVPNTGYVLQLATPYYEELTVRDNLTLAAQIKLHSKFTIREKFKRVEQVMEVTGLSNLADTVVGGETGPGLSGGQKKRLVVALQLLKLPSIIFLDEPTSGLDATSSMELLSHLNKLADSNRTVILTIHQPRLEIFHMFHKLVLLSDGKVAYHGAPEKSYEVFVSALRTRYLQKGLIIPSLEDHNPADVVMDMLGNPSFRRVLTEYYQESREPKLVERAVKMARWKGYSQSSSSVNSVKSALDFALFGAKRAGNRHAGNFVRMAALEARIAKRILLNQLAFLPIVFFIFALVLGTVYFQRKNPFLIVAGMCVFSVASGLFVFPAIEIYYTPALRVYTYERADGVGRSQDLVIQGFIRYITIAFIPVILSTGLIYLLIIRSDQYDILVFLQVAVVNVGLNLTWTAMLIALMLALPKIAFRLSSALASVFGFTSGFFIPIDRIHWVYRWIAYINPNYYGFSSVAFFLLENFNTCTGSQIVCYPSSGAFTLRQFFFNNINPYLHIVILLSFTTFYLLLAIILNWLRHTSVGLKIKRIISVIFRRPSDQLTKEIKSDSARFKKSFSNDLDEEEGYETEEADEDDDDEEGGQGEGFQPRATTPLAVIPEGEEEMESVGNTTPSTPTTPRTRMRIKGKWQSMVGKSLEHEVGEAGVKESTASSGGEGGGWAKARRIRLRDHDARPSTLEFALGSGRRKNAKTPFLREGEMHKVWRPKQRPQLANLVEMLKNQEPERATTPAPTNVNRNLEEIAQVPSLNGSTKHLNNTGLSPTAPKSASLQSRQKTLFNRVIATQAVLKETTDELLKEEEEVPKKRHMTLLEASKKVTANLKKQKSKEEGTMNFSDIVSQYLQKSKDEGRVRPETPTAGKGWDALRTGQHAKQLKRKETRGAIPLITLREIVREGKLQSSDSTSEPSLAKNLNRHSTGGISDSSNFSTEHSPSLSPQEPISAPKLNKMTKLKKSMADRHLQRQYVFDVPGTAGSSAAETIGLSEPKKSILKKTSSSPSMNSNLTSTSSGMLNRGSKEAGEGNKDVDVTLTDDLSSGRSGSMENLSRPDRSLREITKDNSILEMFVSNPAEGNGGVTAYGNGRSRIPTGSSSPSALSKLKKVKKGRVNVVPNKGDEEEPHPQPLRSMV